MGRGGRGRFVSPASEMSFAGAGDGLNTATWWPRSARARAMGTRRVGKPRSSAGSIVNRNLAIRAVRESPCSILKLGKSQIAGCVRRGQNCARGIEFRAATQSELGFGDFALGYFGEGNYCDRR